MPERKFDPLAQQAEGDAVVERAAQELRRLLRQATARLDPFPPYPGAFFTYAIEVEPEAAARADRGCVVVGPDGELYELMLAVEPPGPDELVDPAGARREEMRRLDLHPADYVVYAYYALRRVLELLPQQWEAR